MCKILEVIVNSFVKKRLTGIIFFFLYIHVKKKKQLKKFAKDGDRQMRIVGRGSFKITIHRETLPDKTLFITHAEK